MIATATINVSSTAKSRLPEVDFADLKFGKTFTDHMFVADYAEGAWQDLRIVPFGDLPMNPAISAIHYGQSIFEGLKAYRQQDGKVAIFRPDANFERLNKSAARMCMPSLPAEIFFAGLSQLVSMDAKWVPSSAGSSLYIRPFMFATDGFVGIKPSDTYRFIIFCCPVGVYYAEPVRVKVERNFSRAVRGGTGFAKAAGNYGGALYPSKMASEQGFHQVIWTDALNHENLEEAGTMNVAFIIDGKFVTPALGDTVLNGVTRSSVIALAKEAGMAIEQRSVSVTELREALRTGRVQDGFGLGTAATFAHMAQITIDDEDYHLPAPSALALGLKETLLGIRTGVIADTHEWMYPVGA